MEKRSALTLTLVVPAVREGQARSWSSVVAARTASIVDDHTVGSTHSSASTPSPVAPGSAYWLRRRNSTANASAKSA